MYHMGYDLVLGRREDITKADNNDQTHTGSQLHPYFNLHRCWGAGCWAVHLHQNAHENQLDNVSLFNTRLHSIPLLPYSPPHISLAFLHVAKAAARRLIKSLGPHGPSREREDGEILVDVRRPAPGPAQYPLPRYHY